MDLADPPVGGGRLQRSLAVGATEGLQGRDVSRLHLDARDIPTPAHEVLHLAHDRLAPTVHATLREPIQRLGLRRGVPQDAFVAREVFLRSNRGLASSALAAFSGRSTGTKQSEG